MPTDPSVCWLLLNHLLIHFHESTGWTPTPNNHIYISGQNLCTFVDFTNISLDFSLVIGHKMINDQLWGHPWGWILSIYYHIILSHSFVKSTIMVVYSSFMYWNGILRFIVFNAHFNFLMSNSTFRISEGFRNSVRDLKTLGDP